MSLDDWIVSVAKTVSCYIPFKVYIYVIMIGIGYCIGYG